MVVVKGREPLITFPTGPEKSNKTDENNAKEAVKDQARDANATGTVARAGWPWAQSRKRRARSSCFASTSPCGTQHKIMKFGSTVGRGAWILTMFFFIHVDVEDACR